MRTEDFDFYLPDALIAQHPTFERTASRMLHLNGQDGSLSDKQFLDLVDSINAGDLLVFNDTRVVPARLLGKRGDLRLCEVGNAKGANFACFVRVLDGARDFLRVG